MKIQIITILIILISSLTHGKEYVPFKLKKEVDKRETINRSFRKSETLSPFLLKSTGLITGLAISGKVELKDDTSLVRIILVTENHEYLVFEYFPLIADKYQYEFNDICEETELLEPVRPFSLKVIIKNAELQIDDYCYSKQQLNTEEISQFATLKSGKKKSDLEVKIERINFNNSKKGKTWIAGITEMSMLTFEEKKQHFCGGSDFLSGGFEYYAGGIFSFDSFDPTKNNQLKSGKKSAYVSKFDWRNRHGQNWDTSIKDQGNCGSCWAFTAVAVTEIMTNLYFNNHVDLDLSEQYIKCNCREKDACAGGSSSRALEFISDSCVCDEECFPYTEFNESCDNKSTTPNELVSFAGVQKIACGYDSKSIANRVDSIKDAIINYGPLASGFLTPDGCGHAMALIGYHEIEIGDTILYVQACDIVDSIIGPENPLVGETYWIFKNSYGPNFGEGDFGTGGYFYAFLSNPIAPYPRMAIIPPITTTNTYSRNCTDNDGDGYYWWGIGDKPSSCPCCCPEEPDGDDSDPHAGPMDRYGNLQVISSPYTKPTTNVASSQIWSSTTHVCGDLSVISAATLTITDSTYLYKNDVTVDEDSEIIINGGNIEQGTVTVKDGSSMTISNNGAVWLPQGGSFTVEEGATLEINSGSINTGVDES